MSCNGCRVLRKGCSENCILRPCLQWIDTPESQGYATVFVAKFFGRAGLMSFISNVPVIQRPALFQSLLYEACGRTISPITGAVGLLCTGNWQLCQFAVESILRGGTLRPLPELLAGAPPSPAMMQDLNSQSPASQARFTNSKRRRPADNRPRKLDLRLESAATFTGVPRLFSVDKHRPDSPSMNSDESVETNVSGLVFPEVATGQDTRLLNLFV